MGWTSSIRGTIGGLSILLPLAGAVHAGSVQTPTVTVPTPNVTVPTVKVTVPKVTVPTVKVTVPKVAAPAVKVTVPAPPKPAVVSTPTPKVTVVTPAPKPAVVTAPIPKPAVVVSTPQPVPSASSTYTFVPTNYGTVQVSRNGTIISTVTPQLAAQQYGYQSSNTPTVSVPSPVVPITSGNVTTPSGAVVNAATGQLVSAPPASASPSLPTSTAPATPAYTFSPTASGTVQVFQNGKLISTTTPQLAVQYGYQAPSTSAQPAIPITAPTSNVPTSVGRTVTAIATQPASAQLAVLPVSSTAKIALSTVALNPAISAKNATSSGGYIYPTGTSGSTKSTGLSQQQCAVLVEALRPDVPQPTGKWASVGATAANPKGQTIQDANLSPGTPVATFMTNGRYPVGTQLMDTAPFYAGAPKEPHSGIFIGYLKDAGGNIIRDAGGKPIGFEMLAQSAGVPATIEKRLFEPVPSSSPYSNIQVENYQYSAISTSSSTSR